MQSYYVILVGKQNFEILFFKYITNNQFVISLARISIIALVNPFLGFATGFMIICHLSRIRSMGRNFHESTFREIIVKANGTAVVVVCVTSAAIRLTVPFVGRELSR